MPDAAGRKSRPNKDTNFPLRLTNCRFDYADPFPQTSRLDRDQFEAEVAVSLFVNFLKAHRFLKADTPRFGRRYEAKIANEEDPVFVDCFFFDALQFAGKKGEKGCPR